GPGAPFSAERIWNEMKQQGLLVTGLRNPKDWTETAIQAATTAPLIAAGGAVAPVLKAAPAVGRSLASGAMAGTRAYAEGEPIIPAFLLGTGVPALAEALGAGATRLAE